MAADNPVFRRYFVHNCEHPCIDFVPAEILNRLICMKMKCSISFAA